MRLLCVGEFLFKPKSILVGMICLNNDIIFKEFYLFLDL